MSLLDTIDGCFMNFAYGWAFSKPVRKVYYNITITGLSVAVALVIGTIELVSILADQARHHLRAAGGRGRSSTSTTSATPSSPCSSPPGSWRSRCGGSPASRRSGAPTCSPERRAAGLAPCRWSAPRDAPRLSGVVDQVSVRLTGAPPGRTGQGPAEHPEGQERADGVGVLQEPADQHRLPPAADPGDAPPGPASEEPGQSAPPRPRAADGRAAGPGRARRTGPRPSSAGGGSTPPATAARPSARPRRPR